MREGKRERGRESSGWDQQRVSVGVAVVPHMQFKCRGLRFGDRAAPDPTTSVSPPARGE